MAQEEVGFSNSGAKETGCSARLRKFGRAVCNTEKGEFFGRNASSWAKIGIFYIIFYSFLAGFFATMLIGFFATLDEKIPTQQRMYSLIKANPGMAFRPMVDIDSTLITVNSKNIELTNKSITDIMKVFKDYKNPQNGTVINCSLNARTSDNQVCKVSLDFGPCTEANDFGYNTGTPCILLKMNRVFDWTPKAFSNSTEEDDDVKQRHQDAVKALGSRFSTNHVGVSCEGETENDMDIMGDIEYYPKEGFPFSYYPYKNQDGFLSPLVFVQLKNLKKGSLVQIYCKLWAANIKHHKNDRAGSAHFEVILDE